MLLKKTPDHRRIQMKVQIKGTTPIYELVKTYPDVKQIMSTLGFVDIVKPGMLQSVGRIMTLEKGARMKNIDWTSVVAAFDEHGYTLTRGES